MTDCIVHDSPCHCFNQSTVLRPAHLPPKGSQFSVGLFQCACGFQIVGPPGGNIRHQDNWHPCPLDQPEMRFLGQYPLTAI